ncbi:olfactory receptor [Plakobranchus ocellatus]|uniref:Olfactory receptor n=1 Tax=Plakobranchus ocellatus TaxID=259542 RepID=A0AAV4B8P1_9GAST|nr:olfactory receptor [Plakobranchus ocellatus]
MAEFIPKQVSVPLHCLAVLLSLLGNVSMVIIVCRVPMLHTPTFVFMSNLAATDIVLALVWNITSVLVDLQVVDSEQLSQATVGCMALGMIWQTAISTSTLLQATIACDRYLFIVHPFKYQRHVTCSRAAGCCVIIFVLSASFPTFLFFTGDPYWLEDPTQTCLRSEVWPLLFLTIIFFPSLSLVAFSSQRVWALCTRMLQEMELLQACTPITSIGGLSEKSKARGPKSLILKKLIKIVMKRSKIRRKAKIAPEVSTVKADLNAAPTVMITVCEKGDSAQTVMPKPSTSQEIEERVDHVSDCESRVLAVNTPTLRYPLSAFSRRSSLESAVSPCGSYTSGDQISTSNSIAEKTQRFLSPYSYRSHGVSHCLEDSLPSFNSSTLSLGQSDTLVMEAWSHSSDTAVNSPAVSDFERRPSSANQSLPSVNPLSGEPCSSPLSRIIAEDLVPDGANPVSSLVSAIMVMPEIFLVQSAHNGLCSSASSSQRLRDKREIIAALYWAAVGNPAIALIMGFQTDRGTPLSPHERKKREQHSSQIDLDDASSTDDWMGSGLWTKIKGFITARCSAAKALLLLCVPLLLIASLLPFSTVLTIWQFGVRGQSVSKCVYIVCLLTYTSVPSLTSLLLCLTNKPYRKVLQRHICCHKKTRAKSIS